MNDLQQELYLRSIHAKVEKINHKQNIIIEQLSALTKAFANQYDLAVEDGEMEVEVIET